MKALIAWITRIIEEEEKEMLVLYSGLLQNLSEMAAALLLKLPPNYVATP